MARELPQRKRDWWTRIVMPIPEMADQLREELKTVAACDQFLDTICFAAGRTERDHRDLVKWAEAEGDESAVVLAHRIILRHREAVNASISDVKRWRARLVEAQQRRDP